jgi:hypothetical protein
MTDTQPGTCIDCHGPTFAYLDKARTRTLRLHTAHRCQPCAEVAMIGTLHREALRNIARREARAALKETGRQA